MAEWGDYVYDPNREYMSDEECSKGLTTPRGTFIFDGRQYVKKVDAIRNCNDMGAILAPITEREDFDKLQEFANKCRWFKWPREFHIGFDAYSNETRLFSNGEKWDWEKHSKIYSNYYSIEGECRLHVLNLKMSRVKAKFSHYDRCKSFTKNYICLKPAVPKCELQSAHKDAVIQVKEPSIEPFVYHMFGGFLVVVCFLIGMLLKEKHKSRSINATN